jgi:hypothetical protein
LRVLAHGSSAVLLSLAGSQQPEAIAPAVVIAAIGLCLQIADMLGPKGPSVQDLMRLQMQMLQVISLQLVEIQKGINLILEHLEELKQLVDELPSATVMTFHKTQIQSLSQLYNEKMKAYAFALREPNGTPSSAQARYANEIRDVIVHPLSTSRAAFTNPAASSTPADIPIVAVAMQIELHSLIMAGYGRGDIVAVVSSYRNWFSRMVTGSEKSIEQSLQRLRAQRAEYRRRISPQEQQICYKVRDVHFEQPPKQGGRDGEYPPKRIYEQAGVRAARFHYETRQRRFEDLGVPPNQLEQFRTNVNRLLKNEVHPDELPVDLAQVIDARIDEIAVFYDELTGRPRNSSTDQNWIPLSKLNASFIQALGKCPDSEPYFPMSDSHRKTESDLNSNSDSILVQAALHQAGLTALAALNKFQTSLSALA